MKAPAKNRVHADHRREVSKPQRKVFPFRHGAVEVGDIAERAQLLGILICAGKALSRLTHDRSGLELILKVDTHRAWLIGRHAGDCVSLPCEHRIVDGLQGNFVGEIGTEERRRPRPTGNARTRIE